MQEDIVDQMLASVKRSSNQSGARVSRPSNGTCNNDLFKTETYMMNLEFPMDLNKD